MMPTENELPPTNLSTPVPRPKRERSARYPGAGLGESLELCQFLAEHGLDGLAAADIASALGFRNIKTNTFSSRLSAARQFGLLELRDDGYALTTLARSIIQESHPEQRDCLLRQALTTSPLYAELAERLAGKRVPEASILANVLEHHHEITASAKRSAADAFLASVRFAGALGDDQVLRLDPTAPGVPIAHPATATTETTESERYPQARSRPADVRFNLRLWDADKGKLIRVRAPETISPASFERFLQAFRLHVRIEEPAEPGSGDGA
ncbi:MAG TPA: hypothetical protein VGZ22_13650 [Isosphaeraceae bacterium]|nr:hypothetical protein [Isosphaeraceae bacterium]